MSDKIEEIRITLALNPKQIAERMLSGEVTSESHFVSQEDHLHVASLVDAAHREIAKLRAALRECACACSSIRECESEWAKDNYCLHLNARKALEGKP